MKRVKPWARVLVLALWATVPATSPLAREAAADEIWVAPTYQADLGGFGIGSNLFWPATAVGAVRLVWAVPDDLQTFQSAKVVLIPHGPGGAAILNVFVCAAQNGDPVAASCTGPAAAGFTGVANALVEVDVSAAVAAQVGAAGFNHLAVVAYTTPTTTSDHIVGLRFTYEAKVLPGVATLGPNTFTGIQTAPAFVGDGSGLTNLPAPANVDAATLDGLDSTAFAAAAHGHDVAEVAGAARLAGGNTLTGTQVVDGGHLDLDPTTPASGNILKNGVRFLHDFGTFNTFLGGNAGNFTMDPSTARFNTGIGVEALKDNSSGQTNTGVGSFALRANTTGSGNSAVGAGALGSNTTGIANTALGHGALNVSVAGGGNTALGYATLALSASGDDNTAVGNYTLSTSTTAGRNTGLGAGALLEVTTGEANVAVGWRAGYASTTGSNNIYLGAQVEGVGGESNTMYLGKVGTQTTTVIAGVRGVTVGSGEMVVIDPNGRLGSAPVGPPGANTIGSAEVIDNSLTAADLAPNSVGGSELAPGAVDASKVSFNYAGSASPGGVATNADLLDGLDAAAFAAVFHVHDVSQVGNAARVAGGNAFRGHQAIDGGHLDLEPSSAATGVISKNGTRFLHDFGLNSVFLGAAAGNFTTTGGFNVGIGRFALSSNTTGVGNTGIGDGALISNDEGFNNTASGASALSSNSLGSANTADGAAALFLNTEGSFNTAAGADALYQNTTGSDNVAVGFRAGYNATSGSNNVYLGSGVLGAATDSNVMRLGKVGQQTKTFVAGVRGITTARADAVPVMVDSDGQFGTVSSSRRFKEDIQPMGDVSRRLFQLRPVTFRYTQPFAGGVKPIQFGLVAEEVAEVFPELAVRGRDGQVETVHYEKLSALLLNELQRQDRELTAVLRRLAALEAAAAAR